MRNKRRVKNLFNTGNVKIFVERMFVELFIIMPAVKFNDCSEINKLKAFY